MPISSPCSSHLASLLPDGIPAGAVQGPALLKWFMTDSEEQFIQAGNHSVYGADDITYQFNSLGYRCPEFTAQAAIRIGSFGCSDACGLGVRKNEVFSEIVAAHIAQRYGKSTVNWNLGFPTGSNDRIIRVLAAALPVLNPQIVLIHFSYPQRREYISRDGTRYNFMPRHGADFGPNKPLQDLHTACMNLLSGYDDALNLYQCISAAGAMLKSRLWYFSFADSMTPAELDYLLNHRHFIGHCPRRDNGRDNSHPGPQTHRALAKLYIKRFEEMAPSNLG